MSLPSAPKNINKTHTKTRVLVAPLDWGLGHATRCIPVVRELLLKNFEVILAAENAGALLLQKEFPEVKILPLTGYRIRYGKKGSWFFLKMMWQIPRIIKAVKYEHRWLKQTMKDEHVDIVISDNRFGLWNKNVKTVFITHQLFINTGNRLFNFCAQKINYLFINRFDECWVPDSKTEGLGGKLSHPVMMPAIPVRYIGTLSRFEKGIDLKNIDLLIMLSGPEPQRSIFESLIVAQLKQIDRRITLMRGLPAGGAKIEASANLTVVDHLPANALNEVLNAAENVLCRSGYSTIMEIAALHKKAILIPTPGQTEQEYLAKYLSEKNYCITDTQENFDLQRALEKIALQDLVPFPDTETGLLKFAISTL